MIRFLTMKKKISIAILACVILLGLIFVIVKLIKVSGPADEKNEEKSNDFYSINGLKVSKEVSEKRPIAVMVENHPDARPQSGLSRADIVYETLTEGGITRFMALYQSSNAENIGPIRSAREYFAQIADDWGAVYAHVGGSNEVIAQINNGKYPNLSDADEYYNEDFFNRITARPAPHNVYTSINKLERLMDFYDFGKKAGYQPFIFKQESPATSSTATKIEIDFSKPGYEVSWNYDSTANDYRRSIYFEPDVDAAINHQITAKNIVTQFVEVTLVPNDPLFSVDINLLGFGKALFFQDGKATEGVWVKNPGETTKFYNEAGGEFEFNRGPIWIELVPVEKEGSLNWK